MDVLFIGTEDKGYFASEIAKELGITIEFMSNGNIQSIEDEIIKKVPQNLVINIEQLNNSHEHIALSVKHIKESCNCRIIIFAAGYLQEANAIQSLLTVGVQNFITSTVLALTKEDFKKCLNGYYETNPLEVFDDQEDLSKERRPVRRYKSIAILGSMHRIGTTTAALQIVKYINKNGYKACYIEMNNNEYVNDIFSVYDINESSIDRDLGFVQFKHVDIFYKKEKITDIVSRGYDYYVYDYGVPESGAFSVISFFEKDVSIIVGGSAPTELKQMSEVVEKYYDTPVKYLFNFTSEAERSGIMEMMVDKSDQSFFMAFSPDSYIYNPENNNEFDRMLKDILIEKTDEGMPVKETRSFTLFGKKGKRR